jgi:hypothetical protein
VTRAISFSKSAKPLAITHFLWCHVLYDLGFSIRHCWVRASSVCVAFSAAAPPWSNADWSALLRKFHMVYICGGRMSGATLVEVLLLCCDAGRGRTSGTTASSLAAPNRAASSNLSLLQHASTAVVACRIVSTCSATSGIGLAHELGGNVSIGGHAPSSHGLQRPWGRLPCFSTPWAVRAWRLCVTRCTAAVVLFVAGTTCTDQAAAIRFIVSAFQQKLRLACHGARTRVTQVCLAQRSLAALLHAIITQRSVWKQCANATFARMYSAVCCLLQAEQRKQTGRQP